MKIRQLHPWNVGTAEARRIQDELRSRVCATAAAKPPQTVAGVDVSVKNKIARAAVVVLRCSDMAPLETSVAEQPVSFPYVPGLLSFREIPSILEVLMGISLKPGLLLVDGQGFAHPRRFGLACHLGVLLDTPTIGCAKTRFIGTYDEPGPEAGSFTHLFDGDEVIGAVVRTKTRVKPLFVSIGHKIDLAGAIEHVLGCCRGYRLPEPARRAHQAAG